MEKEKGKEKHKYWPGMKATTITLFLVAHKDEVKKLFKATKKKSFLLLI